MQQVLEDQIRKKAGDNMKQIVCFGDSNTYGLIPGTTDRYDWNTRWTGIVGEEMSRQGYLVQEEGLCGSTKFFYGRSFLLIFHIIYRDTFW